MPPDLLGERGPGVLLDRVVHDLCEVLVVPVPAGEPDQREARRQQPAVGQVVDRRHQLLAGQVAGDPEDDDAGRTGDPRQPLVPRIAQRVDGVGSSRRSSRARSCSAGTETVSCRTWPRPALRRRSPAARPRTSRTCPRPRSPAPANTSSRSMPIACQVGEHRGRLLVGAVDGVAADHAVVGDGVDGLLRRGVDRVRRDQLDDVAGVVVRRVLDAGGGPQRTLLVARRRPPARPSARRRTSPRTAGRPAGRWRSPPCPAAPWPPGCRWRPAACRSRCPPGRRRTTPPSGSCDRSWPLALACSSPSM